MASTRINQLMMMIILLISMITHGITSFNLNEPHYFVLKDNKTSVIKVTFSQRFDYDHQKSLWIYNNQQSLKVQVPTLLNTSHSQKYPISNYSQYFPLFNQKIHSKGYLKPYKNSSFLVKGYRYQKLNQQAKEMTSQIYLFLQNTMKSNQLTFLNFRMEDNFQFELIWSNQKNKYQVRTILVKYLFPTVQKELIPQPILQLVNRNLISQQQYLSLTNSNLIQRKLSGNGFHQKINTTLILNDLIAIQIESSKSPCYYIFQDILPQTTYIDADQRRKQTTNYQIINVQLPAFVAKQYYYQFKVNFNQFLQVGVNQYRFQQPVHFRYPKPSLKNYTKVYLHPIQQARIICDSDKTLPIIYQLKENHLFQRGTAKIPNGDSSLTKIVSIATLAIVLIVMLKITKTLKK